VQNKRRNQNGYVATEKDAPVDCASKVSSVAFAHPDVGEAHADISSGAARFRYGNNPGRFRFRCATFSWFLSLLMSMSSIAAMRGASSILFFFIAAMTFLSFESPMMDLLSELPSSLSGPLSGRHITAEANEDWAGCELAAIRSSGMSISRPATIFDAAADIAMINLG